jgi:predicted AlkP superfamily phosphohydrolase/phosphomutase
MISVLPLLTPPNWTSAYTGVNPGKHGVYGFIKIGYNYEKKLVDNRTRGIDAVWNILSREKIGNLIFNIPFTYPPEKVEGIFVSGGFFIDPRNYTYPTEVVNILRRLGYKRYNLSKYVLSEYIDKAVEQTRLIGEAYRYLMENYDWRFGIVVFHNYDSAMHKFYGLENYDLPNNIMELHNYPLHLLKIIDEEIGKILKLMDKDDTIIIHSDHGFQKLSWELHINTILLKNGLLSVKGSKTKNFLRKLGIRRGSRLFKYGVKWLYSKLPYKYKFSLQQKLPTGELGFFDIDWERTSAAQTIKLIGEMMINVKGKYKYGIINPDQYNDLVEKIKVVLNRYRYNGHKPINRVFHRTELFSGPYTDKAPDLIIHMNMGYAASDLIIDPPLKKLETKFDWDTPISLIPRIGAHSLEGFFMVKSPYTKERHISRINIMDITPLILYFLNIKIPYYMDGIVPGDLFTEDYVPVEKEIYSKKYGYTYRAKKVKEKLKRKRGY